MALEVSFKQCLVDFFGDRNGLNWHHRLLLVPSGLADGRWIAATPDYDVEVLDLGRHRVIPLQSGGEFPADRADECYAFDPLGPGDLDDLYRRSLELARMIGFGPAAPAGPSGSAGWRIADPGHAAFGAVVPEDSVGDADLFVHRGSSGLARVDDDWVYVEQVEDEKLAEWRVRKVSGGGIDSRLLPVVRDTLGRRFLPEAEAASKWRNAKEDDFPLRGPKVVAEFFDSLRATGQTLPQHHMDFVRRSGIPEKGALAKEHHILSEVLRLFATHDQVDCTMLAGIDLLVRRIIMIEMAVARNPRNPEWDGLDVVLSSRVSDNGAVSAQNFESWVSGVQREQAQVMKQGRLLREERAAQDKRAKGGGRGSADAPAAGP